MEALNNPAIPLDRRVAASNAALAYINAKAAYRIGYRTLLALRDKGDISADECSAQLVELAQQADRAHTQLDCAISNMALAAYHAGVTA